MKFYPRYAIHTAAFVSDIMCHNALAEKQKVSEREMSHAKVLFRLENIADKKVTHSESVGIRTYETFYPVKLFHHVLDKPATNLLLVLITKVNSQQIIIPINISTVSNFLALLALGVRNLLIWD